MTFFSAQVGRWGLLVTTLVLGATLVATGFASYLGARTTASAVTRTLATDLLAVRRDIRDAGTFQPPVLDTLFAELEPPPDRRRVPTAADRQGPIGPERATIVIEFEPLLADTITRRALAALATQIVATGVLLLAAVAFWRHSRRSEAAAAQAERDRHLRSLGEMSAVLGHELRNPLASLKGHAQLLLEKLPFDHAGRRGAATIVEEVVRLEGLANQVLDFVKTGTLRFAAEDPVGVASAAIEASGIDGVRLAHDGAPASWVLDRVHIEQVIANLLRNARDAFPTTEPIDLRVGVADGALLFQVSDRGEGLPPGEESRAFEPFFTTRVHGTGLGLAMAKRIVDGHGGTIRADDRNGGGAVFRVTLPPMTAGRA